MVIEPGNNPINKPSAQSTGASNKRGDASSVAAQPQAQAASKQDSVSLSRAAQSLSQLQARAQTAPDVDESKVAAIRQALAEGRYQVDSQSLAGKMLAHDSAF